MYSHVIVDEAQDLTRFQLRAVMRRSPGLTLVGDDAQRRRRTGLGLREAARVLDVDLEQMATAYRMSAEIADWLNGFARDHGIDAVELIGIRPTGTPVREVGPADVERVEADLRGRWANVAVIRADEVWIHKGIEYDGVVVERAAMTPAEVYLAASTSRPRAGTRLTRPRVWQGDAMRFVVVGAGAIGGVVGGRLTQAGQDVGARGPGGPRRCDGAWRAHAALTRRRPDHRGRRSPARSARSSWRPDDVVLLAVKSNDTCALVEQLEAEADPATAVVCLQNGVANERGRAAPLRQRLRGLRDVPRHSPPARPGGGQLVARHRDLRHRSVPHGHSTPPRRPSPPPSRRPRSCPRPGPTSCAGSTPSC